MVDTTMPSASPGLMILLLGMVSSIVGAWIWVVIRFALRQPILPPNTPRVVPWGFGTVLLAVAIWLGLGFGLPSAYLAIHPELRSHPGAEPTVLPAGTRMALSATQNGLAAVLIPIVVCLFAKARLRDFGILDADPARRVLQGITAYALLAPFIYGVMLLSVGIWGRQTHPLEDAVKAEASGIPALIAAVAAVVCAPVMEELLFRSLFLGWLTRLALGRQSERMSEPTPVADPIVVDPVETDAKTSENPYEAPVAPIESIPETIPVRRTVALRLLAANATVALIFAALHGQVWPTPMPIFCLALGLGFLYQRTGSLLPSIVLHMCINGVSTLALFLTAGQTPPPAAPPKPAGVIVAPASTVISQAKASQPGF
jgi:membrane protease YdiL (CAAX protease family)